jgi:hypothetical protein
MNAVKWSRFKCCMVDHEWHVDAVPFCGYNEVEVIAEVMSVSVKNLREVLLQAECS